MEPAKHDSVGKGQLSTRPFLLSDREAEAPSPRLARTELAGFLPINERHQRISHVNVQAVRKAFDLDEFWVEMMRGDLARTLYELTKDEVEYRFGDSIQALRQDKAGVDVTFALGGPRRFDLVVGAGGLQKSRQKAPG